MRAHRLSTRPSVLRLRMLVLTAALLLPTASRADVQLIAPGTGPQNAIVISTGPDGICDTTAATGDIQAAPVGQGTPNQNVIRCGPNKTAETVAAGDDRQLVAVGGACRNQNTNVVDSGDNGIPETTFAGDDTQLLAVGSPPPGTACVVAGANGIADTLAPSGDDVQVIPAGTATANTTVVQCGPNGVADTAANNAAVGGDDVQVIAQGAPCTTNQTVVDSGANGIAETRAEGPDLVIAAAKTLKLAIRAGQPQVSKAIKVSVSNVEFGTSAPATRSYSLVVAAGSCGNGVVSQIDSDAVTGGLQSAANVPLGGRVKASFVLTFKLQNVLSVSRTTPFRCSLTVRAQANDVSADLDDAANVENNETELQVEVYDYNDRI